jgi:hypothetical protein
MLCLSGSLLGCSSKPSASDIAAGVNEFWSGCAKISDVIKTNGVENGNAYRVSFTYKMELLEDGGGALGVPPHCSIVGGEGSQTASLLKIVFSSIAGGNGSGSLKKGNVYTVTNEANMVKSEKGWVFQ